MTRIAFEQARIANQLRVVTDGAEALDTCSHVARMPRATPMTCRRWCCWT